MLTLLPPKSSLAAVAALQRREWARHVFWGCANWAAVVVAAAVLAMFADFRIDRVRDTPFALRAALLLGQLALAAYLGWRWIARPFLNPTPAEVIATRVEEEIPEYGHRLVTAMQLTRDGAKRQGMSEELIGNLTREAEGITANRDLSGAVRGPSPAHSFAILLVPACAAALFAGLLGPRMAGILFGRLFLANTEIPHAVNLTNATPEIWPAGEEATLTYEAAGPLRETDTGTVRVKVGNLGGDDYPFTFAGRDGDRWLFQATIPPGTRSFTHRAWLRGGRSRGFGEVRYEQRPVVSRIDAWVRVPDYVGRKPDGTPYEIYMPQQGEIACPAGATVRIELETSKSIRSAALHLLGADAEKKEVRLRTVPLSVSEGEANAAVGILTVEPAAVAYELEVADTFGFRNAVLPRRSVRILPDSPPLVDLLPERFAGQGEIVEADAEVDGMPLPLGKPLRIDYRCSSPLGLDRARLAYRVNDDPWQYLPLAEIKATEESGPWDARLHSFANAAYQQKKLGGQVEFTALPSPNPDLKPARLEGAGSFTFQTKALKKLKDGNPAELEVGDRVEFSVEVYDRNPSPQREPGKSEARVKEIVTDERFLEWILSTLQSESKLRDLEKRQRGVFGQDR